MHSWAMQTNLPLSIGYTGSAKPTKNSLPSFDNKFLPLLLRIFSLSFPFFVFSPSVHCVHCLPVIIALPLLSSQSKLNTLVCAMCSCECVFKFSFVLFLTFSRSYTVARYSILKRMEFLYGLMYFCCIESHETKDLIEIIPLVAYKLATSTFS